MSEAVVISLIGVFSGVFATAILKILEKFLGKAKEKADADSGIRSELRLELDRKIDDVKNLKKEIRDLEAEVDRWKADYWSLFDTFFQLRMLAKIMAYTDPEASAKIESFLAPHEAKLKERANVQPTE